jgi:hypothetical protein
MRMLPLAVCLTLLLFLPAPSPLGVSFIRLATAQAPDALILKCRKAVFRKYGRAGTDPKKRYVKKNFVVQEVDRCVANGGRVI